MKAQKITNKMLRQAWRDEHSKLRTYKAHISRAPRYGGGTIHLISAGPMNNITSTELYS